MCIRDRIEVLDKMVMRLYEDMIAGRISEQNFNTMLEKTQTEQTELKTKVSEGRKRLSDEVQLANDAKPVSYTHLLSLLRAQLYTTRRIVHCVLRRLLAGGL